MYVTKMCKMALEDQQCVGEIVLGRHLEEICNHDPS